VEQKTVEFNRYRWAQLPGDLRERMKKVWKPGKMYGLELSEIVDSLDEMGKKKLAKAFEEAVLATIRQPGRPATGAVASKHRVDARLDAATYQCLVRHARKRSYGAVIKHALMVTFPEEFDQDEEGETDADN